MAVVYSGSRLRTLYAVLQSTDLRTANATTTGAKFIRFEELTINPDRPLTEPTYKTGTSSPLIGILGRSANSRWTLRAPLIPSGTAGTPPDTDPILQSIFGAAPTGSSYALSDAILPLTIYHFDKTPGSAHPDNFFILGAVPETVTFTVNGPMLEFTVEGRCVGICHTSTFANYTGVDAVLKGGLTAFPTEPGSATTSGNIQPGFGGSATFGGTAALELRGSPRIVISTGIEYFTDAIGEYYPVAALRGLRTINISGAAFAYSDSAILQSILVSAFTKGAQSVVISLTPSTGNNTAFTLANAQLGSSTFQESGAFMDIQLSDIRAHTAAVNTSTDLTLVFS